MKSAFRHLQNRFHRPILKQYTADLTEQQAVRLAIQALLEVVDSGAKSIELVVVREGGEKVNLEEAEMERVVTEIEAEQQESMAGAASGDA